MRAMIYAIEEINKSHFLLPNISLGFQIFDNCLYLTHALWQTLITLTGQDKPILNYQCNLKIPLAIIGDAVSLISIAMSTILGIYRYPQVSYSATVSSLNDRLLYPSFFRTVPSDDKQALALARLVSYMGWKWVGLISLDTDYGILGSQILKEELQKLGVCVAYHETFGQGTSFSKLLDITNTVAQSSAKVVILFSRDPHINYLMELFASRNNVERVWLATNGWATSPLLSVKRFSQILVGTVGFSMHEVEMLNFKNYLLSMRPSTFLPQDTFIEAFWEFVLGCRWPNSSAIVENGTVWCTGEEKLNTFTSKDYDQNKFDLRTQYFIHNAVYALAQALHALIFSCEKGQDSSTNRTCLNLTDIKPWQVFHHLKMVNFRNPLGEVISFDSNGNPPPDYDILNWQMESDGSIVFVKVGRYHLQEFQEYNLSINTSAINWITGGQKIPNSVCSETCPPGFRKAAQKGQPICCYDCIRCSEGEISNQPDSSNCIPCSDDTWPNENNTACIPKPIEFLSFSEPLGATLTSITVFFTMITIVILYVFIKYNSTAIVKANNSSLTYCLLVSLSLSFLCSLLFIGEPLRSTCLFRQGAFGVIFVICVSCIFAKTLMVVIAFRAIKPGSNMKKWLGPKVPISCVIICTSILLFICIYWMFSCPSFPEMNTSIKYGVIIYQCNECNGILLWCMLGYIGFLACASFLIAFLARNLPDAFNEAKWITFSMLMFLSVWISFVPAYLSTQGKLMVAVEVFGIISSSAGILSCFFFPKCYIILLRPELNTSRNVLGRGTKANSEVSQKAV
ncbi:extracellular calcium-sensing receptor-like [Gastrophryne carolinensis]